MRAAMVSRLTAFGRTGRGHRIALDRLCPRVAGIVAQAQNTTAPVSLPLDEFAALVERMREEAPKEAVESMEMALARLRKQQIERAALMKRSWSDTAFEEGEAGNDRILEQFERELVSILQRSSRGLADAEVLGNAIDLAGAYKKNYKLEKAEAVLIRCTRHAEERSGAWLVKYLNHMSQVRMKQSRDVEAMEMMYEMESLATFSLHEPGASEFYETLYRNMSSSLRRMGREDDAAVYFLKMAEASRYHKKQLDWMDLWDLGILIANRAYQASRWEEFYKSREIIAEALLQLEAVEPHELILRAKVLSNLGQCYLATEEFSEAEKHYMEAYSLFSRTVGKRSPLFGMQAWACGNLRCAQQRFVEAIGFLGEALYVEVVKDGLSVSEMMKLVDQVLHSLDHVVRPDANLDSANLEPLRRALNELIEESVLHSRSGPPRGW
ncbi:unnamed protein product [Durusdinium trenchii]|uniref:Uncharacterized protein n=1 Tax=Durusdinium trenchii TaxID=1381693 RepID=A0ABP0LBF6_9DINO